MRTRRRSASLVFLGLTLGVGLAGAILVTYVSTGQPFTSLTHALAAADWQVQPYVTGRLPEEVLRDVEDAPGVTAAAPLITEFVLIGTSSADSQGALLVGSDCRFEKFVGDFDCGERLRALEAAGKDGSVPLLAGPGLAELAPESGTDAREVGLSGGLVGDAVIVDVVDGVPELMAVNDGRWVLGAVTDVQALLETGPYLSSVLFNGDDTAASSLRTQLAGFGGTAEPGVPGKVFLELARNLILVSAILVLAGGTLIAATSYLLLLDDRRRTFAIAGVLGVSQRRMVAHVCGEGAVLGAMAGVAALPMTWVLGSYLTRSWGSAMLDGTGASVRPAFPVSLASLIILGGVCVGVAAALPVALRTARADALVTVREDEDVTALHRAPRWLWALAPVPVVLGLWIGNLWGEGRADLAAGFVGVGILVGGLMMFTLLFTPVLTRWIERLRSRHRAAGLITSADLARDPFRWAGITTVISMALMVGLGLHSVRVLSVDSMARHVETEIAELVYVHPRNPGDQLNARFTRNAIEQIEAVEGVAAVHPQYLVTVDDNGHVLNIAGTDPEFPRRNLEITSGGEGDVWPALEAGEAIVADTYAAKKDIEVGDTIVVPGPSGPVDVHVAAVADAKFFWDNGIPDWVLVSNDVARETWAAGVDWLVVEPEKGASPRDLADRIVAEIDAVRTNATDQSRTHEQASANGSRFIGPVEKVGWVMLVVSAAAVTVFLTLTLVQRRRLRIVLRNIGYTSTLERRTLLYEAAILAVLGFVYGVAGMMVLSLFMSLASPALLATKVEWRLLPGPVALGLVAAAATACIGIIYPWATAARLDRDLAAGTQGTDDE